MSKTRAFFIGLFCIWQFSISQNNPNLEFFLKNARGNNLSLKENNNLGEIGIIQSEIIKAKNNAFQIDATAEVLFAPYFNNYGRAIDITTTPSPNAYGYDVGITNGGLYSAQVNVTKNLFNQATVANLLFQNKVKTDSISLSSEEISHNISKNITDFYVIAYQLQLQEEFTKEILKDLEKRLQVVELLVKRGILQESDYLLLQLDIESKRLELEQIKNNKEVAISQLYSSSGMEVETIETLPEPIFFFEKSFAKAERFYERKFSNDSLQVLAQQKVFDNIYRPRLIAYGNTGLNAVEIPNIENKIGASAGLRLTIPIYDGRQRYYNTKQNEFRKENLEYFKDNAEIKLENTINSITSQLKNLEKNKALLEKQIQKQENILEIYKGKLVQGQVSIVDYLNVVQNYKQNVYTQLQMQTNKWLLQSQYNFINW